MDRSAFFFEIKGILISDKGDVIVNASESSVACHKRVEAVGIITDQLNVKTAFPVTFIYDLLQTFSFSRSLQKA